MDFNLASLYCLRIFLKLSRRAFFFPHEPRSPLAGARKFSAPDLEDVKLRLSGEDEWKYVDYRLFLQDESLSPRMGNSNPVNFDHFYKNLHLLEQMFSYLDTDSSGSITQKEFTVGLREALETMDAEERLDNLDDLFKMFDHNGDGRIDQNEFFEGFRLVGLATTSPEENKPSSPGGSTMGRPFLPVLSPPNIPETRDSYEQTEEALKTADSMLVLEKMHISNRLAFKLLCDAQGDLEIPNEALI